jgi:TolB protein
MRESSIFVFLFASFLLNCGLLSIDTAPTVETMLARTNTPPSIDTPIIIDPPETDLTQEAQPSGHISFSSSFDGNSCEGTWEIYVMDISKTSDPIQITNNPGVATYGSALSSDGTKIAFDSMLDGDADIYIMNADGTGEAINLTNNEEADDFSPDWSPDNKQIVFHRRDDAGIFEIMTIDIDTREEKSLVYGTNPDWSPDGTRIVFGFQADVYVLDLANSEVTNLTDTPQINEIQPKWSPDGSQIAFQTEYKGNAEIFVMNAFDSSEQSNLTSHPGNDFNFAWSPDGKYLAFQSWRNEPELGGAGSYIYIMNKDGGNQRYVTKNGCEAFPSWSK